MPLIRSSSAEAKKQPDYEFTKPSEFDVTMPIDWEEQALMPGYEEVIAAMSMGEGLDPDYTDRKRVLVVADDQPSRLYLRARLSLLPHVDVYEASSGAEAVQISQYTPFDGVLMDVSMSDANGYEVCRIIKRHSRQHGTRPPKIFIVTNRSGMVERMKATLAGADAFLSKPPHPGKLGGLLESL
jgi:CheY-like chemotaxis protein